MASIALLPWGDAIEDFLAPHGLTLADLRDELAGGWLFGYVEALRTAGVEATVVCMSSEVAEVRRWRHAPTGAPLLVLPLPRTCRALRRVPADRYAQRPLDASDGSWPRRLAAAASHQLEPYLATPVRALGAEARRAGWDAVLCQEYEYARCDVLALARRRIGVPVYASFQGGDRARQGIDGLVRRVALPRVAGFVVGPRSEAERLQARHTVPASRIARVPNPVDPAPWRAAAMERDSARAELAIEPGEDVVGWHGRVDVHRKGLDVLLAAWSQLERPGRRLLLIGDGPDRAELRAQLDAWGLRRVTWIDEYVLDKLRVARLLSAADVFVLPSRHEGFPVAPLEAMALGLPVVAADAPGVREVVLGDTGGPSGLVVAREDADALATALDQMLTDRAARGRLGRRGMERIELQFSPRTVGRALRAAMAL